MSCEFCSIYFNGLAANILLFGFNSIFSNLPLWFSQISYFHLL